MNHSERYDIFCDSLEHLIDAGAAGLLIVPPKDLSLIHIYHVSPGKKMFTWGCGELAESWEKALTDADGRYCELMAGSYSNNQPDFTWLNPYETKCFSEFWYPIGACLLYTSRCV